MNNNFDFCIVGGGMVGLSIANQLIERKISSRIIVIEKEAELGLHSSGLNSGVLHAGLYYEPKSLKAKVCVSGAKRLKNWVKERIKRKKLKPVTPVMKKGDCIIWSANMLHGSPKCKNPKLSRRSQVTHWTFTNVKEHYNPVFSNIDKSLIIKRSVNYIR